VIFCVYRLTYTFMGKWVDKNIVSHTSLVKLIPWAGFLGLYLFLAWSFSSHSLSFINLSHWLPRLSQCLHLLGLLAIGLQTETPQSWRWSMKLEVRRRGLYFVLSLFLKTAQTIRSLFFRCSKGMPFIYY